MKLPVQAIIAQEKIVTIWMTEHKSKKTKFIYKERK
jgi:hypothetical protein